MRKTRRCAKREKCTKRENAQNAKMHAQNAKMHQTRKCANYTILPLPFKKHKKRNLTTVWENVSQRASREIKRAPDHWLCSNLQRAFENVFQRQLEDGFERFQTVSSGFGIVIWRKITPNGLKTFFNTH